MPVEVSTLPSSLELRAQRHAALADPVRLRIIDLLALSDRSPTAVATSLGIGSNLLAHHLRVLERVRVIERLPSEGDGRRYYLRLSEPSLAAPETTLATDAVLFVCTGNSARSQLAAALWNERSDVPAESAGTHPADRVHPMAVDVAAKAGLDLSQASPRGLDAARVPALVVTVCDRAREERSWPAGVTVLHWWIPDPRALGTRAAFEDTLRRLDHRIDALAPRVATKGRRRPVRRTHP